MVTQAELNAQPGLAQINAVTAFDNDIFGEGALISVIDTGIDENNAEFAGRIDARSADVGTDDFSNDDDARTISDLQDNQGHGTAVAAIAAGAANGAGSVGVAPDATILAFRGNLNDDPDTDDDDEALTILGGAISEGFRRSVSAGADVINLSLGSDEDGSRESFANLLAFAGSNNVVTVLSAGNEGDADPQLSGQAVVEADVAGTAIVVGAVDFNNNIASFSNTAGLAAEFFIVAPGVRITTAAIGGGTRSFSGTSASAPHVSGAVGLVRALWPQLSAAETVEIILDSATDLGAPGTDPIFGRGLLNVGAALEPSGQLSVPSATGSSAPVSALASNLPSAAGSGFADIGPIVGIDRFGRDFSIDLNGLVDAAPANRFAIGDIADPLRRIQTSRGRAPTPGASLTFRLSETSAASDPQFAYLSGNPQSEDAFAAGERTLAFSFSQPLAADRQLTLANGFSGREVDRAQRSEFTQSTLSRTAFSDAYLSDTTDAVSAGLDLPGPAGTALDIFVNRSTPENPLLRGGFGLQQIQSDDAAGTTTVRLGITRDVPGGALRFETGVQTEEDSFLGTRLSTGLFGDGGSRTIYNAISGHVSLTPNLSLQGRFSTGFTTIRQGAASSFLTDASGLRSTQFSIGLQQTGLLNRYDRFNLSLSQPLQIRTGDLTLSLPTSFNQQTEQAQFTNVATGFAGGARPLDVEAGYTVSTARDFVLQLNAGHSVSGIGQGQTAVRVRLSRQF